MYWYFFYTFSIKVSRSIKLYEFNIILYLNKKNTKQTN
jgi:hypothetical protein